MSRDLVEAVAAVKQQFPPGDERLYDWDTPSSWAGRDLREKARAQVALWGQQERLRRELNPATAIETLTDWERLFGLAKSGIAQGGNPSARQAQLVARWREFGAASHTNIRNALQVLIGATAITIVEQRRTVRTAANWLDITPAVASLPLPIAPSADTELAITAGDNGPVSSGGARVTLRVTHPSVEDLYIEMFAPDGASSGRRYFGRGSVTGKDFAFRWKGAQGLDVDGVWRIVVTDSGASGGTIDDPAADGVAGLLVEGIGRNTTGAEGYGAPVFVWYALVNPGDVGFTTDLFDRKAVAALVRRWNPGHCRGYLCLYNSLGGQYARCGDPNTPADGGICS